MYAEKKRVFVGNLPPDITQTEIAKWFNKFGNVLSVEIKKRPDSSTFAFLDFIIEEDKLNSCFATLSTKKWNDKKIKLELAKESFLSRLQKERHGNNKSESHCSLDDPYMINKSMKSKKRSVEELGCSKKKQRTKKTISVINYSSFNEEAVGLSDNTSDSEIMYNGKLKMFGGTRTAPYDSDSNFSHTEIEPDSKTSQSANAATNLLQRLEIFSDVWRDSPMNCDTTKHGKTVTKMHNCREQNPMDKTRSLLAEEKRKKSVDEKRKSFQKQKETIKLALSSVGSGFRNNKIVFDSENKYEDIVKQTISHNISQSSNAELLGKSYKKTILFEDSSDGDEEGNLKVKPQFEGVKGQKLLELQSRFASDNRFALDERFYESDEEVCAEASDSVQTARVEDERRRQFEILKDVLGHPIPIKEDKKDKSKRVPMLRFDPTKPDHAKFEEKTEPKIKRKVPDNSTDKEPKVVYDTKEEKIQNVAVSKENFYKVAKSLKETLQKRDEKNEFSLRKLFGASDGGLSHHCIQLHNWIYCVFNLLEFSQFLSVIVI
ncbi:nucleolar protein 8-like isoform X2 [Zootermopsis nevadensis]|uniref:nucleolar protein 8-like isoform X2 n=1 Tax=Zootermopsis nevadensis TaxID=136037 RepID=UPI000B8EB916|nr:nucleolar protein 8-like isoform X2 [Zootermopsis nevadensis]